MSTTSPIMQETHYDPWGLVLEGIGFQYGDIKANKYLYNGKELQQETDWYDYGARMYMADLGRFTTIDPWSEKYNDQGVYNYAFNNPVRFTDFMGLGPEDEVEKDPDKVTKAAEKGVEKATESCGTSTAACNIGVGSAFEELTGSKELRQNGKDGNFMLANDMAVHIEGSNDFEKMTGDNVLEQVQEGANDGEIIIAFVKNEDGSGHIVIAVPGKMQESSTWGEDVPQVMDTGSGRRLSQTKASTGFSSSNKPTWYRFTANDKPAATSSGQKTTSTHQWARERWGGLKLVPKN